jgi:tetratricopeptide (TPR) repeat protein
MPEKTINDLPRDLRMLHTKAAEALQRDNFDYAIELFTQILAREPAVFEIRKTLRAAQAAKSGGGGGFFKRAFSSASSSPQVAKAQMAMRKNPAEAMTIAETILNGDPNNSSAHKIIAEAAIAMQMPKEAVMSLEILVKNSPKDKELSYQLAEALADSGHKTRGEQVLGDLQRLFPADQEIGFKLKDLSARKTLDEGGYEKLSDGTGSYRDVLRNKTETVALEQANRQVKTDDSTDSLIRDWQERVEREPGNVKMLRNLAEVYVQKGEFDKALGYYEKMQSLDGGNDASLAKQISEVKVRKFNQTISQLDATAVDHQEKLTQLKADKQAFQIEECRLRAERYPTDLQIRFELGSLYFEAGKITEAIQEFQKAQNNPNRRIQSITFLAKCFEKRGMNDLAARRLQDVLKEKLTFDEEKKDLVYTLGCVFDKMGKKEEAIEQFKMIYETDIGYRDVAKRVDDYYAAGGT